MVKSEYVLLNEVPVRIDCYGDVLPSDIERSDKEKPKEIILMIPGNPGIITFYEEFLTCLHEKTKICVWIVSHGGHDKHNTAVPPLDQNKELYNLQGQIQQKRKFIEKYLNGVRVYYIGHSIGCKMLLEVIDSNDNNVEKCFFLFPTIERMVETENGKKFMFTYNYLYWIIFLACHIFAYLPSVFQVMLVKFFIAILRIPPNNINSVLELIDPHVVKKILFLAHDELQNVRELDYEKLKQLNKKIKLYYGKTDGWVPLTYYHDLKSKNKEVDAEVCMKNIDHAFVLKDSMTMADIVSAWILHS